MYFKCTRFSTISRIKNVFTKVFFNSSNSVKIKKKKKKKKKERNIQLNKCQRKFVIFSI